MGAAARGDRDSVGRTQRELGELGELGGLPVDATLRRSLDGSPTLELQLRGVPSQPASLGIDLLRLDATSLVRQLEHRVGDLPALADRLQADGLAAADEAARAQRGLAQPFKHADALAEAIARAAQITAELQRLQGTATPPAGRAGAQPQPEPRDRRATPPTRRDDRSR